MSNRDWDKGNFRKPSNEITAKELINDKKNTRKVLAEEVEELYGIINNLKKENIKYLTTIEKQNEKIKSYQDSISEYEKQIDKLDMQKSFHYVNEKREKREKEILEQVIVAHAKKQAGY